MPTINIKSIKSQGVLDNADYQYILDNLNKDIPLLGLNFTADGELWALAVYKGDGDCVSLFVDTNKLEYTISSPIDNALQALLDRKDIVKNIHDFSNDLYTAGMLAGRMSEIDTLIDMLKGVNK